MLRVLRPASAVPRLLAKKAFGQKPVRYEAYGSGPVLFLGFPISAGPGGDSLLLQQYLDRLTDGYHAVVMEYPPTGNDADTVVDVFTPDRVCADILAVADAAVLNALPGMATPGTASSAFNSLPERID